jgi:hypothetical protein
MRALNVFLFLLCACKPIQKNTSQTDEVLQKIVKEELGENAIVTKNSSKSFALATLKRDESIQYAIIRISDNKVVMKNKIRGTIDWSGEMQLTESRIPGIIKKDSKPEDYSRVINLNQFIPKTN